MTTITVLLSIAYSLNWHLHQLDIITTFLHMNFEEEVYMKFPFGHYIPKNMVCKLNKSIYGLKHGSLQWNKNLTNTLIDIGFSESKSDYSLITKKPDVDFTVVLIYVDR